MPGLITPLSIGFPDAPLGYATAIDYRTGDPASMYDADGNDEFLLDLDARGRVVAYSDTISIITVFDLEDEEVAQFTFGHRAIATEYIGVSTSEGRKASRQRSKRERVEPFLSKFIDSYSGGVDWGDFTTLMGQGSESVANVKDYGAIGNGVADDDAAFESAAEAGLAIYVPSGTYRIVGGMNVTSIFGDGVTSQILFSSGGGLVASYASDLRISASGASGTTALDVDSGTRLYVDGSFSHCIDRGSYRDCVFARGVGEIIHSLLGDIRCTGCRFVETREAINLAQTSDSLARLSSGLELYLHDCVYDARSVESWTEQSPASYGALISAPFAVLTGFKMLLVEHFAGKMYEGATLATADTPGIPNSEDYRAILNAMSVYQRQTLDVAFPTFVAGLGSEVCRFGRAQRVIYDDGNRPCSDLCGMVFNVTVDRDVGFGLPYQRRFFRVPSEGSWYVWLMNDTDNDELVLQVMIGVRKGGNDSGSVAVMIEKEIPTS